MERPEEIDAKERSQKRVIARYERLLKSYARMSGLPRQCLGMEHVENAVLILHKKGTNESLSKRELVALAGVIGELALAALTVTFLSPAPPPPLEDFFDRQKREAILKSAKWLVSGGWFRFWILTLQEAEEILSRLVEEYYREKHE